MAAPRKRPRAKTPAKSRAKPPRRRLTPAARRAELLGALEHVVSVHGFVNATVPRVVAEAGVAQGSFYRYFTDIDAAFAELAQGVLGPIAEAAWQLDFEGAQTASDVDRALERYYRVLAQQIAAHPALVREALIAAPAARGPAGEQAAAFLAAMREHVLQMVTRHMGEGPFRAGNPRVVTGAVMGMVTGAVQEAVAMGDDFEPERWAKEMARFEAGALVGPAAPGRPPNKSTKKRSRNSTKKRSRK